MSLLFTVSKLCFEKVLTMRPTSRQLAMRDPALAALMGAVGNNSSDFGTEDSNEFDADFGVEFGDDYGVEFAGYPNFAADPVGAATDHPFAPQNQAQTLAMWNQARQEAAMTASRARILEPNKGSKVKIERYAFSVNANLVLGTASPGFTASGQPDTNIRPQRVTMNAPGYGFVQVTEIKVANVSVTVGGIDDAYNYNANGVGQSLDMPTLSPSNRATVAGNYTGYVPPGFVGGTAYLFVASFKGPASVIA